MQAGCVFFTQAVVAIDGSKFKAVNSKSRNDTQSSIKRRIKRTEEHIANYLAKLDEVDVEEPSSVDTDVVNLKDKLVSLRETLADLKTREKQVLNHPDKQLSETDPDARLMKNGSKGSVVGYNVQTAVDTEHKLIIAHEVISSPTDRGQLLPVARLVQETLQCEKMTAIADRGYYKGEDIRACNHLGIKALVPKSNTSGNKAAGRYERTDFTYDAEQDHYICPANEILFKHHSSVEHGMKIDTYYVSVPICRACKLKPKCTTGLVRRVRRWEHEGLLETMADELRNYPDAMTVRAQTVEHPFGTIKLWMGTTQFLMKRLENVRTEMSLHVLAYNMKRMTSILGVRGLIEFVKELTVSLRYITQATVNCFERFFQSFAWE